MTKLSMIAACLLLPGCLGQAYEARQTQTTGVTCVVPSGDYTGCDGQSHSYVVRYWAASPSASTPAESDAGLQEWSCWADQVIPPGYSYSCPAGAACAVWDANGNEEQGHCEGPPADAGATPDPLSWCLPYAEVDAPPGSGSLPDPVPGRTCHTETSGNLIYWCCVSGVE